MNDNINIIIVDDDPAHIALVKRNLSKCGLAKNITALNSGQQALDFVHSKREFSDQSLPQHVLILLDINMSGISGIEVLKTLKNKVSSQHIPVIMLTTSDDPAEIDICFQLGCNAYLVKPVEHQKFAEKIQALGHFLSLTQIPRFVS